MNIDDMQNPLESQGREETMDEKPNDTQLANPKPSDAIPLGPPLLPPPPASFNNQPFVTQDYPSRNPPYIPIPSGRPRGHTVADALSSVGATNALSVLEGIPRAVYNPPPDFLQRTRPVHSHIRTTSSSSLPNEHGRATGFEWHQGQRQGTETPPPGRRGSDSPGQHVYDQYPLTPGLSGPPSRRSTDESNYASPPNASDYSGSYFSASSGRLPISPVAGQLGGLTAAMSLSRELGGRRDSSAAAHPYLRRPSLGESVAGQTIPSMSWGYLRARSPLGVSPTGGAERSRIEDNDVSGFEYEGAADRDQSNNSPRDRDQLRASTRQARIESEQRRRNEMRDGFDKLKFAMPQTSQRASKASILDRAVQYIMTLQAENRHLKEAQEKLLHDNERLREANYTLVKTQAKTFRVDEQDDAPFHFEPDYGRRGG